MSVHYFDPSAWVKRHFQEEGSEAVNTLFRASPKAACSRLGVVEMVATVARKSQRESLDKSLMETILDNVRDDFAAFWVVPVDEQRIVAATDLAIRHCLRTMDSLHLACALSLRTFDETIMVSADLELLAAAGREGLPTLNPVVSVG